MMKKMIKIGSKITLNSEEIINDMRDVVVDFEDDKENKTIKDEKRLIASFIPLVFTFFLAFHFCNNYRNLLLGTNENSQLINFGLFIWTLTFGLFGLFLGIFFASFDDHTGDEYSKRSKDGFYITFLGKYLVSTIAGSIVIFGVLRSIPYVDNKVFFWLAAAMSLYYGYIADIFLLSRLKV